jgi:predicted amidohydrolase YtcJ
MEPDVIFTDAKAVTADRSGTRAQAVAITNGVITAVREKSDVERLAGPSTRRIGLGGRTMIPGLIDSHIHALRAGRTWTVELHWEHVNSVAAGLAAVPERAAGRSARHLDRRGRRMARDRLRRNHIALLAAAGAHPGAAARRDTAVVP